MGHSRTGPQEQCRAESSGSRQEETLTFGWPWPGAASEQGCDERGVGLDVQLEVEPRLHVLGAPGGWGEEAGDWTWRG